METAARRILQIGGHIANESAQQLERKDSNAKQSDDPVQNYKSQVNALHPYRQQASFDAFQMKLFVQNREYEIRERVFRTLINDPLFRHPTIELELSRKQNRELTHRQMMRIHEYGFLTDEEAEKEPWKISTVSIALTAFDTSLAAKYGLHTSMFISCLKHLGTERHRKYVPLCETMQIIGCFALTEFSHGSNVRGIQTTATFDKESQEFIIHSPSLEAYKCWIGLAGKTANYTCLLCNLIVNGKNYGIHAFVVPLRSMVDHLPLPGVLIGDMGEKIGQNGLDHGFIAFSNYRIPRENLLNKIADVLPDGTYTGEKISPNKRFAMLLNPLSSGRVGIVGLCNAHMINALTIAIRYSAVRKQFGTKEERPVIEYQFQQYRLFPYLAATYVIEFFRKWLLDTYQDYMKSIISDKPVNGELSAELHAITSASKPFAGWLSRDAIQTARECCGGHGYLSCNRIGLAKNDHEPNLTYEGDNNVLIQQTSKYLLDQARKVSSGGSASTPLGSIDDWMNMIPNLAQMRCKYTSQADFRKPEVYLEVLRYRVANLTFLACEKMQEEFSNNPDAFDAWNNTQAFYFHSASRAYIDLFALKKYMNAYENCKDQGIRNVLGKLASLFALSRIEADLAVCRDNDYLSSQQASFVKKEILVLCSELKHEAVSLVDAIAPPDEILYSPIGKSNGNAYGNLFATIVTGKEATERADWWTLLKTPTIKGSKKLMNL